jgi:lysophospholipase L1-like esterase
MAIGKGKKAAFSLLLLVFIALVAEAGFRIAYRITGQDPDSMRLVRHDAGMKVEGRYISNPFLPFALRPNSDYDIVWTRPSWPELKGQVETRTWHIHQNKWGFRGPDVSLEKPPGTLRVLCLGGSTTYDTNSDGETWEDDLQSRLADAYPGQKIEVLNFGMNAASMPFHVTQFALLGVNFKPDLVIVYAGHNDLWSGLGLKGFRPDYSHRLGHWDDSKRSIQHYLPAWAMRSVAVTGIAYMIDHFRGIEYDLVKQIWRNAPKAEDPLEGFWAFRNDMITIDGIARAHGARTMFITPFYSFTMTETKRLLIDSIKRAADGAGLPLLDAANLLPAGDISLVVDNVHFSPKGSEAFAKLIADFISSRQLLPAATRSGTQDVVDEDQAAKRID